MSSPRSGYRCLDTSRINGGDNRELHVGGCSYQFPASSFLETFGEFSGEQEGFTHFPHPVGRKSPDLDHNRWRRPVGSPCSMDPELLCFKGCSSQLYFITSRTALGHEDRRHRAHPAVSYYVNRTGVHPPWYRHRLVESELHDGANKIRSMRLFSLLLNSIRIYRKAISLLDAIESIHWIDHGRPSKGRKDNQLWNI